MLIFNILQNLSNILPDIYKGKSGIKIKESHKGRFTDYCGGKVTEECINRGKNSSNPSIRKLATFAKNARGWVKKHQLGGSINPDIFVNYRYVSLPSVDVDFKNDYFITPRTSEQQFSIKQDDDVKSETIDWSKYIQEALPTITTQQPSPIVQTPKLDSKDLIKGDETAEKIYKGLISRGLNSFAAAAATVCFNYESGFRTDVVAKSSSRGSKTYSGGDTGLALWTGSRKKAFERKYGKDLTKATLDEQLDFVADEINRMPRLKRVLNNSKSFIESLNYFVRGYEGGYDNPNQSDLSFENIFQESVSTAINKRLKKASKFLNV